MSKGKGTVQGWLAVLGLSAAFAVYGIATQESAPEGANASRGLPATADPLVLNTRTDVASDGGLPTSSMGYSSSGHKAGYAWAMEHDITSPDECGGDSDSFVEGCEAYAEEIAYENDGY